jgi:hypothetical protein
MVFPFFWSASWRYVALRMRCHTESSHDDGFALEDVIGTLILATPALGRKVLATNGGFREVKIHGQLSGGES